MKDKIFGAKNNLKVLFSLLLSLSLVSCQTITISPEGKPKLASNPDYEKTQHFFLGGLIGESVVPAGEICGEKSVAQLQSQTTFWNGFWPYLSAVAATVVGTVGFLGLSSGIMEAGSPPSGGDTVAMIGGGLLITLGIILASTIYTPKTAKVWCGKKAVLPAESSNEAQEAG